jgi:hypothetical protein
MKTFLIKSVHSVYIDSFENGEHEHVNEYSLEAKITAETIQKAIETYFEKELFVSNFDLKNTEVVENHLEYNYLVDNDNCPASEGEIERWKKDEITLYSNNASIEVFELVECDLKYINTDLTPAEKWVLERIEGAEPETLPNGNVEWRKDGCVLFIQYFKNGYLWVSSVYVRSVLRDRCGLNDNEIKELLTNILYDYTDNGKLKVT